MGEGWGEGVSAANALEVQGQLQLVALAPLTRLRQTLHQWERRKTVQLSLHQQKNIGIVLERK